MMSSHSNLLLQFASPLFYSIWCASYKALANFCSTTHKLPHITRSNKIHPLHYTTKLYIHHCYNVISRHIPVYSGAFWRCRVRAGPQTSGTAWAREEQDQGGDHAQGVRGEESLSRPGPNTAGGAVQYYTAAVHCVCRMAMACLYSVSSYTDDRSLYLP